VNVAISTITRALPRFLPVTWSMFFMGGSIYGFFMRTVADAVVVLVKPRGETRWTER
ncbi:MAG: hypothetical protein ACJA0P_002294, partial [Planctomycetota bacterium]